MGFQEYTIIKFATLLTFHLAAYFNLLKQGSQTSESLKAYITMIPKTLDEVNEPQAFRPIFVERGSENFGEGSEHPCQHIPPNPQT